MLERLIDDKEWEEYKKYIHVFGEKDGWDKWKRYMEHKAANKFPAEKPEVVANGPAPEVENVPDEIPLIRRRVDAVLAPVLKRPIEEVEWEEYQKYIRVCGVKEGWDKWFRRMKSVGERETGQKVEDGYIWKLAADGDWVAVAPAPKVVINGPAPKKKSGKRAKVTPSSPIVSDPPSAKDHSDPSTRVSLFNRRYPNSSAAQWTYYEDVGWVYADEQDTFEATHCQCAIINKWFGKVGGGLYSATKDRHVSKTGLASLPKDRWVKCAWSALYTEAEDIVECMGMSDETIRVSSWYLQQRGGTETCDYSGKKYIPGVLQDVKGSPRYKRVCYSIVTKRGGAFQRCKGCGNFYEKDMNLVRQRPDMGEDPICDDCYVRAQRKLVIGKHNADNYPPAISTKVPRLSARKGEDGLYYASNETEMVNALRLYGVEVELEMSLKGMKRDNIDRFKMALDIRGTLGEDFVMIKDDGSLLMNGKYSDSSGPGTLYAGFEVVSAPADLPTHRERWSRLTSIPFFKHLRSWDTETCGLHVHVDRTQMNNLQIARILYFVNHKGNREFMIKIAGRGEDLYCRYIEHPFSDVYYPAKVISPEEPDPRDRQRRVAINIGCKHTFEFRIFRGTVNPIHIIRDIEFCDAMIEYSWPAARSLSLFKTPNDFIIYVAQNVKRWPMLAAWFWKSGMIKVKAPNPLKANMDKVTLKEDMVPEAEIKTDPPKRPDRGDRMMMRGMPVGGGVPDAFAVNIAVPEKVGECIYAEVQVDDPLVANPIPAPAPPPAAPNRWEEAVKRVEEQQRRDRAFKEMEIEALKQLGIAPPAAPRPPEVAHPPEAPLINNVYAVFDGVAKVAPKPEKAEGDWAPIDWGDDDL